MESHKKLKTKSEDNDGIGLFSICSGIWLQFNFFNLVIPNTFFNVVGTGFKKINGLSEFRHIYL